MKLFKNMLVVAGVLVFMIGSGSAYAKTYQGCSVVVEKGLKDNYLYYQSTNWYHVYCATVQVSAGSRYFNTTLNALLNSNINRQINKNAERGWSILTGDKYYSYKDAKAICEKAYAKNRAYATSSAHYNRCS